MSQILLEKIYKRILIESSMPSIDGYAAYIYADYVRGGFSATLYDHNRLYEKISRDPKNVAVKEKTYDNVILGHINVEKPKKNCEGAWEVRSIAGEGYASILYGLGYAMSANGLLMPDRSAVSTKAYSAWSSQYEKGRPRVKLDDDTCQTHDENDADCTEPVVRDPEPLNYAYEAYGWEYGMQDALRGSHDNMMKKVEEKFGEEVVTKVNVMIKQRGREFFRRKYSAEVLAGRA